MIDVLGRASLPHAVDRWILQVSRQVFAGYAEASAH